MHSPALCTISFLEGNIWTFGLLGALFKSHIPACFISKETSKRQLNNLLTSIYQLVWCTNIFIFLLVGVEPEPFRLGEHLVDSSGKLIFFSIYVKSKHKSHINVLYISEILLATPKICKESLCRLSHVQAISTYSHSGRSQLMLFFLISVFGSIGKLQVIDQLLIFLKARYNNIRKFVLLIGS